MLLVGMIMAVLSGLALPAHIIFFGRVINEFIFYAMATSDNNGFGNTSITSIVNNYASMMNISCSESLVIKKDLISDIGEPVMLLCDPTSGGVFAEILIFVCAPKSHLLFEIHLFSLIYVGIGVYVLLTTFFANIFFNISAYRQTKQIRHAFYYSLLHQEIGWFDVNSANELNTRLTE